MTTTEKRTKYGIHWRSEVPASEPAETWRFARNTACLVAETEAIKTGRNHTVAITLKPMSVNVLAAGDPALHEGGLLPMYEISPDSRCVTLGAWPAFGAH